MDFGSAVKILSGKKSSEQNINETPSTSKVITATVVSKSENGLVKVALDGQVFNEDDSQYIELDTVGGLEEGDTVNILLTGNSGYGLTPFAIGSAGSIDRLSERVTIAQEAGDIALATNQHFWTDTSGAHVTDDTSESWNAEYAKDNHGQLSNPTDNDPWHNILLNSLGILLRRGLLNLTSISKSAIAFYDGTGNSADNITASFGGNGAIIGKTSGRHVVVGVDGLSVYNSDGTLAPVNSTFDGKNIDGSSITGSKINFSTFEDGVISGSAIDTSTFKNGTISGSVIDTSKFEDGTISGSVIDTSKFKNGTISGSVIDTSKFEDGTISGSVIDTSKFKNGTIEGSVIRASTLTGIPFASIVDASIQVANIADAQIGTATIKQAQVENLSSDYAHIQNGIIDNAKIGYADVNDLSAHYAHIQNGVIDNAKIGYADVNNLSANYAKIDMANVNNGWITNGTIANAAIKSEMVESISANKLTAGVINAYDISVTNLHASSLIVDKLNGQPVIGGYTYIPKTSSGYSSKNPKSLGWYEMTSSGFVKSDDTTVDMTKAYYLDGEATELYDRTYIDNLASELGDRIDGAIETFTTDTIPTLNNYPASDWLTDKVKGLHVGDICYVVNPGSEQDGYCYRFAYDNTSAQYKWVLIKDNQVTAALGRITDLETFESETTSWIEETDEGLTTIRTNHTNLAGVVDKTITETKQLWFTKANTTAPNKPTAAVTSTSTAGNAWRTVVPAWNASYPNYYYCLQYKLADGTYAWSDVVRDIAMGESQATSRDAQATADSNIKSSIQLWFTKANTTAPGKPTAEVTTNSASTVNAWNKAIPTYNSSYPNYFTCYQQQKGDNTYQWTDVVYDRSISEAQAKAQASLPSSTFETFKTTTFKEVVDEVDEQSSKITKLSTLTGTLANPNLTQWFSAGVPKADGAYWQYVAGNGAPYIQLEDKGDGWMHAVLDNTSGTGTRRFDFDAVASDAIGLGKNYTFLFEFRNINSNSVDSQVYVVQEGTYGMQFWGNYAQKLLQGTSVDCTVNLPNTLAQSGNQQAELCDDGIYRKRIVRKSEDSDSTYWTRSDIKRCLCMVVFCSAGGHFDAEFRFSIYDGEYLGPYKPYVPITEYTKTSNTVNDVKQTANANYAHLTNLTTTLGTNADGTSKSEDIVHKYNTLDQTLDGTISRVGATEAHMETIANPNLTPYFSHPEEDIYDPTTNPHGYWHVALNSGSGNWTPLEDGWARLSYNNSNGTGSKYGNVRTEIIASLKYDTDYTLMVEARNVTISGTVYLYGIAKRSNTGQFASTPTSYVLTSTDSAVYYQHAKTLSDYTGLKESTSGYIQITAGASITGDFRFSLYESAVKDDVVIPYSGPYKPYTDQNVSNYRVTKAETVIDQTTNNVLIKATKSDTTAAQGGQHLIQSLINVAPDGVTINADKVNIEGSAIFSSGGAFDTSATVVKSEMQWYSSTSATSATGGSWKASQPSVAEGHYIWQRELVTYANGTTAYKPSSAGVCIQGQTDLSDYSTTTAMNTAIGNAVDDIEIGGRNLVRWTDTQVNGGTWNKALDPSDSYGWYRYTSATTIAKTTDGMKFTHDSSSTRSGVVLYLGYPNAAIGLENLVISFDYRTNMTTLYNPYLLVAESGNPMQTSAMACTASETEWVHGTWKLKFPTSADKTVVAVLFGYVNTNGGWLEIKKGTLKLEKGTKETGWSPAPEDVANDIESAISGQGGFTILWDYSAYATYNLGEAYICALDPTTNETSDANGWVMWNGVKRTVPKGMINPNSVHPFNTPLFVVLRLSSATATTGTNYIVHYNDGWKSGPMSAGSLSDWEWVEETDIVLGTFVMTGAETAINSTMIFRAPWSSKQVTTATVTANSAYALANTANNTANAAAPKSGAIARSQRIYYRQTTSGNAPGKNTTWLATSGTGYGNWSLSIPQMTNSNGTKYPKLYTAVQTQTVAQQAAGTTCTCSTVLLDDSITVIDGGSIITGSITANILKATIIDAVNGGDGKISADKINVSEISIGQSQVSGLDTALSGKETAGAAATVQSNLNTLASGITWMGTCSTAATTAAKVVVCAGFNADDLKTGATICVRFNAANTLADAITLNVNGTGAKTISAGQDVSSETNQVLWASGSTIRFYYNGTYWRVADTQPSYYGTCTIAAGTAAKTSSISGAVIYAGTTVNINMTHNNTANKATLNVSSTGAKYIYYGTSATTPTTANEYGWHSNETASFIFDGQFWRYTNSATSYTAVQSAKTASNYIYASSNGIKIANATPSTAKTYQLQTASSTDFVIAGAVRNRINGDGMTLYDDSGTANSNIVAKFTNESTQIGKMSGAHLILDSYETNFYGEDGTTIVAAISQFGNSGGGIVEYPSGYGIVQAVVGTRRADIDFDTSYANEQGAQIRLTVNDGTNTNQVALNTDVGLTLSTPLTHITGDTSIDGDLAITGSVTFGTPLTASQIPSLAASKITSGTFASGRIPNLAASKITSGTLNAARVPNIAALNNIHSGSKVVTLSNGKWLGLMSASEVESALGSGASQSNTICIAQNGDFNSYDGVVTGAMGQDGSARAYIYPNHTGAVRINFVLIRFE